MVHGQDNCASILLTISKGAGTFDRLYYKETSIPDLNDFKLLFSTSRCTVVLLAAGENIRVKQLRMKSLNGDCSELTTGKFPIYPCSTHFGN